MTFVFHLPFRRYAWTALGVFWFAVGGVAGTCAAVAPEALFQQAMLKETGERDVEAAVELYKQVIEQAGSDRRLISNARLRLGGCYERLGKAQDAEQVYQQILSDTTATPDEVTQTAQAHLERLQAEGKARDLAAALAPKPMVLVREFQATRWLVLGGPAALRSGNDTLGSVSLALRYRLSPPRRRLVLFGEVGGLYPLGNARLQDTAKPFASSPPDSASLKLRYQTHLALVMELPHGHQRRAIPELGIGAALTSSDIGYTSGNKGAETASVWSPYLSGGVHLFPDRLLSWHLQAAYTSNPYANSIFIASPAHVQSFDFPAALWEITAQAVLKIGWSKTVLKEKE